MSSKFKMQSPNQKPMFYHELEFENPSMYYSQLLCQAEADDGNLEVSSVISTFVQLCGRITNDADVLRVHPMCFKFNSDFQSVVSHPQNDYKKHEVWEQRQGLMKEFYVEVFKCVADVVDNDGLKTGFQFVGDEGNIEDVRSSSLVNVEKGIFFHSWENFTAVRKWVTSMQRAWQAVLEYRIGLNGLLRFPVVGLCSYGGKLLTVMPLIPIASAKSAVIPSADKSLHLELRLLGLALRVPADDMGITVFAGKDSSHYCLLKKGGAVEVARDSFVRLEAFGYLCNVDGYLIQPSPEAVASTTSAKTVSNDVAAENISIFDASVEEVREALLTNVATLCIASMIKEIEGRINTGDASGEGGISKLLIEWTTTGAFVARSFHTWGLNMCLLFDVFTRVDKHVSKSDGQSTTKEGSNREAAMKALKDVLTTEMIFRSAKAMLREELHIAKGKDLAARTNKMMALAANKNDGFWADLNSVAQRKFNIPGSFKIKPLPIISKVLGWYLSPKFGAVFDPASARFSRLNHALLRTAVASGPEVVRLSSVGQTELVALILTREWDCAVGATLLPPSEAASILASSTRGVSKGGDSVFATASVSEFQLACMVRVAFLEDMVRWTTKQEPHFLVMKKFFDSNVVNVPDLCLRFSAVFCGFFDKKVNGPREAVKDIHLQELERARSSLTPGTFASNLTAASFYHLGRNFSNPTLLFQSCTLSSWWNTTDKYVEVFRDSFPRWVFTAFDLGVAEGGIPIAELWLALIKCTEVNPRFPVIGEKIAQMFYRLFLIALGEDKGPVKSSDILNNTFLQSLTSLYLKDSLPEVLDEEVDSVATASCALKLFQLSLLCHHHFVAVEVKQKKMGDLTNGLRMIASAFQQKPNARENLTVRNVEFVSLLDKCIAALLDGLQSDSKGLWDAALEWNICFPLIVKASTFVENHVNIIDNEEKQCVVKLQGLRNIARRICYAFRKYRFRSGKYKNALIWLPTEELFCNELSEVEKNERLNRFIVELGRLEFLRLLDVNHCNAHERAKRGMLLHEEDNTFEQEIMRAFRAGLGSFELEMMGKREQRVRNEVELNWFADQNELIYVFRIWLPFLTSSFMLRCSVLAVNEFAARILLQCTELEARTGTLVFPCVLGLSLIETTAAVNAMEGNMSIKFEELKRHDFERQQICDLEDIIREEISEDPTVRGKLNSLISLENSRGSLLYDFYVECIIIDELENKQRLLYTCLMEEDHFFRELIVAEEDIWWQECAAGSASHVAVLKLTQEEFETRTLLNEKSTMSKESLFRDLIAVEEELSWNDCQEQHTSRLITLSLQHEETQQRFVIEQKAVDLTLYSTVLLIHRHNVVEREQENFRALFCQMALNAKGCIVTGEFAKRLQLLESNEELHRQQIVSSCRRKNLVNISVCAQHYLPMIVSSLQQVEYLELMQVRVAHCKEAVIFKEYLRGLLDLLEHRCCVVGRREIELEELTGRQYFSIELQNSFIRAFTIKLVEGEIKNRNDIIRNFFAEFKDVFLLLKRDSVGQHRKMEENARICLCEIGEAVLRQGIHRFEYAGRVNSFKRVVVTVRQDLMGKEKKHFAILADWWMLVLTEYRQRLKLERHEETARTSLRVQEEVWRRDVPLSDGVQMNQPISPARTRLLAKMRKTDKMQSSQELYQLKRSLVHFEWSQFNNETPENLPWAQASPVASTEEFIEQIAGVVVGESDLRQTICDEENSKYRKFMVVHKAFLHRFRGVQIDPIDMAFIPLKNTMLRPIVLAPEQRNRRALEEEGEKEFVMLCIQFREEMVGIFKFTSNLRPLKQGGPMSTFSGANITQRGGISFSALVAAAQLRNNQVKKSKKPPHYLPPGK